MRLKTSYSQAMEWLATYSSSINWKDLNNTVLLDTEGKVIWLKYNGVKVDYTGIEFIEAKIEYAVYEWLKMQDGCWIIWLNKKATRVDKELTIKNKEEINNIINNLIKNDK